MPEVSSVSGVVGGEAFNRCPTAKPKEVHSSIPMSPWSSGSTILASLASSMSQSVMSWKGFGRLGSSNTESRAFSCYLYFKLVDHEDAIRKPFSANQASKKKHKLVILLCGTFPWFWRRFFGGGRRLLDTGCLLEGSV